MKIEVLISCMHQNGKDIVLNSNIQTDVLVVNQCEQDSVEHFVFENNKGEQCQVRILHTTERGLSRSRNMALRNAQGDICLICDDDEILEQDYPTKIKQAFTAYPHADLIAFRLNYSKKQFSNTPHAIGRFMSAKVSSAQVAFRREKVLTTNVFFDEQMGSGTGNGGGEEIKFLFQILGKGLKMMYVPSLIATIKDEESMWFKGYTKDFFINYGWSIRRIYGWCLGYMYLWYHIVRHHALYRPHMPLGRIIRYFHIGFRQTR